MDNKQTAAPVIPLGTESMHNAVYNPANANSGQAASLPDTGKPESEVQPELQSSPSNAPVGTTFEELAAKKGFKSADDLAAAYANLESQNKRVEMGLSELAKLRSESTQQPTEEPTVDMNNVQSQEDALKVVEKIVRKHTRPLEDQLALQNLFMKNPDAQQYAGDMARVVKENPGISWEVAYKAAKFDRVGSQAKEEGRKEAYQTIQKKQEVAVGAGKPTASRDNRPLDELIKDKGIPFTEVQRIMRERFSQ